ncbi:MAG: DNA-3-methyladenine glycosylase [Candidatus Omnitrophica bacterium]|nr:DNA-3-methyladenine glycosylase [Candidatus Omnitrophota bacterium]MCF7878395.1 DNA-3-methyladenine glycosylase [Candidatus Omnitrophota bacterium]MCF7893377.1 DNA-3-methyladenine glycosylase [Candidatus Omnitrophota bacterium]
MKEKSKAGENFSLKKESKGRRKKAFFSKNAKYVAKSVLGDFLVLKRNNHFLAGRIVETESYLGIDDDASHSFSGKKTARNEILYQEGGIIYVYLIYGLYWCFNIVTSSKANPQAVFIRALEPVKGFEEMKKRRGKKVRNLTNGPCRWTMAFGIDKNFLRKKIYSGQIYILEKKKKNFNITEASRIGIDYAQKSKNLPLRYYIEGNEFVSKK